MKTLRYLLMVVAMVSVLGVYAQGTAQFPEATMQSTSSMVGAGSSLPQAAATGATLAGETPAAYSPGRAGHIRRGVVDDDDDIPKPGDNVDPDATPIGDVFWPLMVLALAYALVRVILNRKRAGERR